MNRALRSPDALAAAGLDRRRPGRALERVAARYAVAITPAMAELIDPDDPADPIARQFVPTGRGTDHDARGARRPDRRRAPSAGAGHRPPLSRPGAAEAAPRLRGLLPLLLPPRDGGAGGRRDPDRGRARGGLRLHRRAIREIWEVMSTGGDPFVLSPRRLGDIADRLAAIDHVKVVRFHTRVPVVEPGPRHCRAGRGAEGFGRRGLRGAARQPSARVHAGSPGRLRAPRRGRDPDGGPDGAAARASTTMPRRSKR